MSWTVIKDLKEKRAKSFADSIALTKVAETENRDLNADEATKHAAFLAEVESFGKRIEREEKTAAMSEMINGNAVRSMTENSIGMPAKDYGRYSILRALRARVNNQPLTGIEKEVNDEIIARCGKSPQGFYVPMDIAYRALNTTTGTGAVGVQLEKDYIELLRNKMVLNSLGATIMADMHGKFSLPRQSGGATAYWLAESGSPTASNQTMDQVAFVPKTVGAYTDISRSFLNQSSVDAETVVKTDLAKVLANAIDAAGLVGTGSSNQPTGINATSGINAITHGTNGGLETYASVVAYETAVLAANIDPTSKLSYVSNSKVNGILKTTDKTSGGFGNYLIGTDGKLNNYNFAITNAMPSNLTKGTATAICSSVIFGNFADLVVAFWGNLDLTVDPYTGSSSGTVRIVALQDCDIEVRHPLSFASSVDTLTA